MGAVNEIGVFFIGPESEWFWTALTGVVTAITFLAIYRQLRLQSSMAARQQLSEVDAQWRTELMSRFRLSVYESWLDGSLGPLTPGFIDTCDYWELVGGLVRSRNLDFKVVEPLIAVTVTWWWAIVGPTQLQERERVGDASASEDFEWLARRVREGKGAGPMIEAWGNPTPEIVERYVVATREHIALLASTRS